MNSGAFLLLCFVFSSAVAQIIVTWTDCGTTGVNSIKTLNVSVTPDPPVLGVNLTVTAKIFASENITGGNNTLSVEDGFFIQTFPQCTGGMMNVIDLAKIYFPDWCPTKKGEDVLNLHVFLSKFLPDGSIDTQLSGVDQNGRPTICLTFQFTNQDMSKKISVV